MGYHEAKFIKRNIYTKKCILRVSHSHVSQIVFRLKNNNRDFIMLSSLPVWSFKNCVCIDATKSPKMHTFVYFKKFMSEIYIQPDKSFRKIQPSLSKFIFMIKKSMSIIARNHVCKTKIWSKYVSRMWSAARAL